MLQPLNNKSALEHFNIHNSDYALKARVRQELFEAYPEKHERHNYGEGVTGWNGYVELPGFGVTGFIPREADGSDGLLVFAW